MVSQRREISLSVERQYASTRGDIDFARLVESYNAAADDEALAELIEVDGRARVALGKHIDLRRYLDAVADLPSRPVPLDAAIDVTLRSLSKSSRPTQEAVQTLAASYPDLAEIIREAATLADAMCSTTGLRKRLDSSPLRAVPSDFGPRMATGARRFELRRLLGSGGWGEVYLALDRQLSEADHEALVALKFLTGRDKSPWARQRLIDEATKARRVGHAGVVRVLDRGVSEDDEDYIVYEYVEGGDLGQWLAERGGAGSPRQAARMMATIARGVHAAHAAGLVHCDLKPGNILMTRNDEPKVADFGIAVRSGEILDLHAEQQDGRPIGNIAFISPEQFRIEDGSLTIASDVYALGGILYFLLTRRLPNGDSVGEISKNHDRLDGRTSPPRLCDAGLHTDCDLEAICSRAMSLIPEHRYSSASAMADDLEAWVARVPIPWTKPSLARRTTLWATRNPVIASVVVASMLVGTGSTVASFHWSSVATAKTKIADEQTKVAATQTEESAKVKAKNSRFLAGVRNLYKSLDTVDQAMPPQDMLPVVMAMEWMRGSETLGAPDLALGLIHRVPNAQAKLERLRNAGAADSIEATIWETVLAIWLLRDGNALEAQEVLAATEARLSLRRNEGEPWLEAVLMLRAAACVQQLKSKAAEGSLSKADVDELILAEQQIQSCFELPGEFRPNGAVAEFGNKALFELYGPTMLNRAEDLAKLRPLESASSTSRP